MRMEPKDFEIMDQVGYNMLFRAVEHEIVPACSRRGLGILAYMPVMQGLLAGRWKKADDIPVNRRRTRHFSAERDGIRHGEPGFEGLLFEAIRGIGAVAEELGQSMGSLALAWLMAKPG